MIAGRGLAPIVVILLATTAGSATAQDDGPTLAPHRFTLSAGVVGSSGYPVGDRSADLRRNTVGNPAPVPLFRAESTFEAAPGFDARVDFAVTRSLAIEVGAAYSTPRLEVTVAGDSESDANVQLGEEVSQYAVDVSGLWHLPRLSMGRRVRPYIMLGGGYLRQLHEDRLVAETGGLIHAGGGVRVWFTGGSVSARASGLRAEARLVRRSGGIGFDDGSHHYPIFSILGFFGL